MPSPGWNTENIPFFLGEEFDKSFPHSIKVLQAIKDFTQIDISKTEAFWTAINLADKSAMKKICNDKVIKKLVANLFNLHNAKRFTQSKLVKHERDFKRLDQVALKPFQRGIVKQGPAVQRHQHRA